MSSFFLKLFSKKRLVNSLKVFSASIKSINPIQKYPHVIESHACILKIFVFTFLFYEAEDERRLINLLSLSQYVYPKTIKISNITIMNIQSNPVGSSIRVSIKTYYISPILYFGDIISRINPIKSRFILIKFLYFKVS